jgi:hypothetical protein
MSDETSGDGFTFADPPGKASDELPKIDFSTFLLSLATSALFHMGMTEGPGGAKGDVNLPLARQTIDTLELLEEKTQGNLSDDEAKLLEGILYELRMAFVASSEEK